MIERSTIADPVLRIIPGRTFRSVAFHGVSRMEQRRRCTGSAARHSRSQRTFGRRPQNPRMRLMAQPVRGRDGADNDSIPHPNNHEFPGISWSQHPVSLWERQKVQEVLHGS